MNQGHVIIGCGVLVVVYWLGIFTRDALKARRDRQRQQELRAWSAGMQATARERIRRHDASLHHN